MSDNYSEDWEDDWGDDAFEAGFTPETKQESIVIPVEQEETEKVSERIEEEIQDDTELDLFSESSEDDNINISISQPQNVELPRLSRQRLHLGKPKNKIQIVESEDETLELEPKDKPKNSKFSSLKDKLPIRQKVQKDKTTKSEHLPKQKNIKSKGSLIRIREIPIWFIILSQVVLITIGIMMGALIAHKPMIFADNFPNLRPDQTYVITSIEIGDRVKVEFQEYDEGMYGDLIKFEYKHETDQDSYYKLFKYYLREGDIVLHTDKGDLNRLIAGYQSTDSTTYSEDYDDTE